MNVSRNGQVHAVAEAAFWDLVWNGGMLPDDLIWCRDGRWRRPHEVDGVKDFFPQQPSQQSGAAGEVLVGLALLFGAVYVADKLLEPERRPRRIRPNRAPLSRWLKEEIRERDGHCCSYCGARLRVGDGHIDHKNPRVLGGSNRRNNLVLACAPCNLAKGDLKAQQFERLLESL